MSLSATIEPVYGGTLSAQSPISPHATGQLSASTFPVGTNMDNPLLPNKLSALARRDDDGLLISG